MEIDALNKLFVVQLPENRSLLDSSVMKGSQMGLTEELSGEVSVN
jgi:hypothetical protein